MAVNSASARRGPNKVHIVSHSKNYLVQTSLLSFLGKGTWWNRFEWHIYYHMHAQEIDRYLGKRLAYHAISLWGYP